MKRGESREPSAGEDGAADGSAPLFLRAGIPHILLLTAAGWLAWRPVETVLWSAVLVTAVVLVLLPWGWQRTPAGSIVPRWTVIAVLALAVSGAAGLDPSRAVGNLALVVTVAALAWLASRSAPPDPWPAVLAAVLSGLAVWAFLQAVSGPEHAAAVLDGMPEALRAGAEERLESSRGYASQPLPSHLAVLLATALPLLLARIRPRRRAALWALAAVVCVAGLVVTRSPVGVGLALAACAALAAAKSGRVATVTLLVLGTILVGVVAARDDVLELEPVRLRVDNWNTALWAWSTAPAAGVGFGGFGQAAQAVPFEVGNRPRHAHCLPLEWLAELGVVGLLAAAAAAAALMRLVVELWPRRPDLAVAVAVVPLHNLVDFSLAGSGVALPWAVLLGWAVAERGRAPCLSGGPPGRTLATIVAVLALAGAVLHATSVTVLDTAAQQPAPSERFSGAATAWRLAPWRTEPLELMSVAALESADPQLLHAAGRNLHRGRRLRPRSGALADLASHLAAAQGRAPSAVAAAWQSQHWNPANPVYGIRLNGLLARLEDPRGDAAP